MERPQAQVFQYKRVSEQPENPYVSLVPKQEIAVIPSFTLESGVVLKNVPVAFTTLGKLSAAKDNALVVCHALTGSADVSDWWGPLVGRRGRAMDTTRFFVVCLNSLGSPYGSASPVTCKDGDPTKERYGPEFPLTTVRDDVRIHKLVLDDLCVRSIAVVMGGSMGGMLVLEYAYFGPEYVRAIIPIATSSQHSAWGISWGEAQRQSIYCDPKYDDGYYSFNSPPLTGLGAARMSALLTYRSRNSFEARFGRNAPDPSRRQTINGASRPGTRPASPSEEHWAIHNDGHRTTYASRSASSQSVAQAHLGNGLVPKASTNGESSGPTFVDPQFHGTTTLPASPSPSSQNSRPPPTYFSAQSYLRYQGEKFVRRFDGNCYIAITRKLDTHDVARGRVPTHPVAASSHFTDGHDPTTAAALAQIQQPALVLGIESDGLFTFAEQRELAAGIPNARLRTIDSPEGHDAFLLQFEQVNRHVLEFLHEVLPDIMNGPPLVGEEDGTGDAGKVGDGVGVVTKTSTFGEAEVEDITAW